MARSEPARSSNGRGKATTNRPGRAAASKPSARGNSRRTSRPAKNLLLRGIDPEVLKALEVRAKRSGRSLQQELHIALRAGARRNFDEARAIAAAWHARLAGRTITDSVELIREDRDR